MIWSIIWDFFKKLFGLDKKPSNELQSLEKKASEQKKKLEEIDNEEMSDSDVDEYLNK